MSIHNFSFQKYVCKRTQSYKHVHVDDIYHLIIMFVSQLIVSAMKDPCFVQQFRFWCANSLEKLQQEYLLFCVLPSNVN